MLYWFRLSALKHWIKQNWLMVTTVRILFVKILKKKIYKALHLVIRWTTGFLVIAVYIRKIKMVMMLAFNQTTNVIMWFLSNIFRLIVSHDSKHPRNAFLSFIPIPPTNLLIFLTKLSHVFKVNGLPDSEFSKISAYSGWKGKLDWKGKQVFHCSWFFTA